MRKLVLAVLLFAFATICAAQNLTVAAAADLNYVLPEIANRFQSQTGKHVKLIFGSSGNFAQQIRNGAPFDLFFSADIQYPQQIEAAKLTEPGTLTKYANGSLVLFVPNNSKMDISKGLRGLLSPDVKKIAIANPAHAPYGRAAIEALKNQGLYEPLRSKFAMGENISQAAQFVTSGNADAGLIAASLAHALRANGSYLPIPQANYSPIEQAAVVLKTSKDKQTAKQFLEFVTTPEIRKLLRANGFVTQ